jgi:iron complex outermembrane receptor protein
MCDLTGQRLVGAPRWILNPDLNINRSLGENVSVHALLGYAWRSGYFGTPDNSRFGVVAGYGLLNLRLGLSGAIGSNKWDFSLWANNALDKHYVVGGLGGPTFGTYSLYPGTPCFWGASIRVSFQ